ncbi:hypothetical protein ACFY40_13860 [Streptomyces sp. NPDC012950]|uniref:hypothetical protein n=1 Tax=Streptomyces sp. NPDC012950 TaxID=3364858 RepID=UPI0036B85427
MTARRPRGGRTVHARRPRGGGRTVHVRFSVRELPGIAVTAPDEGAAAAARRSAQRALTEAGRGHLGGRVELRTPRTAARSPRGRRAVRRAADRAVALAVAACLRGDTGTAHVPIPPPPVTRTSPP